uniref:Uncharacterized protein n=1 Tax=Proboscia inermis TaxID=420281 RepID=A0A7S0C8D8_9STRA|mmetsp:Transcript_32135/g.32404  ORF Transcript_32135/g.32404 Transcript_32135/m.32404 type:complete len:160 (+) Transcript_32135:273-752(+)|eukprot:CAMPEP_0171301050 /NCGR_PEP_ID=MMETSP0816-20121228/10098_1 /TAXON_ID=420281 /ORGANISM="Proboscia inermis, Strain CCAP1064/1" /LENGTH=159 /DNA_ID=CAMNT_0011778223 /DNA_START=697 /DNA_END=1176 /DNA_ORIENTATION=-
MIDPKNCVGDGDGGQGTESSWWLSSERDDIIEKYIAGHNQLENKSVAASHDGERRREDTGKGWGTSQDGVTMGIGCQRRGRGQVNQITIVVLGGEGEIPIVALGTDTGDPIPDSGDVSKNKGPNPHRYQLYIYLTYLVAKVISLHNNQSGVVHNGSEMT